MNKKRKSPKPPSDPLEAHRRIRKPMPPPQRTIPDRRRELEEERVQREIEEER